MLKKTLAGLAVATVALTAMHGDAQAGSKKKFIRFGFDHHHYEFWHRSDWRSRGCHRYKHNAIRTGSRYWWKRYRICNYDRYYDRY
ncbi:hypothetical protein MnTg02_02254 [bacterium MnTg02]|nr:hypothetical protein MnTg02_02254 [bacterium MnTg02]